MVSTHTFHGANLARPFLGVYGESAGRAKSIRERQTRFLGEARLLAEACFLGKRVFSARRACLENVFALRAQERTNISQKIGMVQNTKNAKAQQKKRN